MKVKNESLYLVLVLFTFCAVGAFVLAGLNQLTAPIIAQIEVEKTKAALKEVAPNATDFKPIEYDTEANLDILEAYSIKESGSTTGYCMLTQTQGFGGTLKLMVGVTKDGTILGVKIVSLSETPGLGTKANDEEWLSQYILKKSPLSVVKNKAAADGEIVAVSGATVTSKAVTHAVETAIAFAGGIVNE